VIPLGRPLSCWGETSIEGAAGRERLKLKRSCSSIRGRQREQFFLGPESAPRGGSMSTAWKLPAATCLWLRTGVRVELDSLGWDREAPCSLCRNILFKISAISGWEAMGDITIENPVQALCILAPKGKV